MKHHFFLRLFLLSTILLINYNAFSQLESIRNPENYGKVKKQKKPGARMTDFIGSLEYEFNMIKNPSTGKIPEGVFEAEKLQAKQINESRAISGREALLNSYTFQGPDNLGGRTRTIAYDVRFNGTTNQIILAGGVSGGVYKSIDNGATWVRKSPTGQHFSCTSIAQDPRVGFQDTWYYGVGEAAGNSTGATGAFYSGNGVYKSTDNGETWTRLANSNTSALETFSTNADFIQKVIVDPTNGNVYAACAAAILRSIDGGSNWTSVLSGALSSSNNFTDIVVTSTGRFYAGFAGTNAVGADGVWASNTGAAASWTRIAGPGGTPAGWNANAGYGRVVLAIAPSNQSLVYALYANNVTSDCAVVPALEADFFRWDNSLSTWTDLSLTLPNEAGCLNGNDPFAVQGGYDLVVAVKPDDPTVVFIGGTNIYRSTTSGASWTRIGGYVSSGSYGLYLNSHPDIHSIVFQPGSPAIMLCGNDGGIQRTTNDLAVTVAWTPINNGYRTYQYYYVANDPRSGNAKVIGGAQDNGSTRNIGGTGINFEPVFSGDGVSVGLSGATNFEYVGTQRGPIYRRLSSSGNGVGTNITPTGESGTGLFVTLFKLDPDNTERLYYANDNALYRTTTASTVTSGTWTSMTGVATSVGAANDITALAMTRGTYSAATASLFMGTTNGKVFRLNDPTGVAAATAPVDITGTINAGFISSIAVNPRNDDTVLVTVSNYGIIGVYWTGNANAASPTWTAVEGALTLPSYRSSAIAINGGTGAAEYYVGTSTGLWASAGLPGAVAWAQEGSTNIGNAVIFNLDLRPSDNKLLIGTHGYGMWSTFVPGCPTITVTNPVTATGTAGVAFSQTFTQTGAVGGATFTINTGTLPTGLTLSSAGLLSGTPTQTGSFPLTIKVTDGNGCMGIGGTYTLVIGCQTITVTNPVTATGTSGVAFSQTFTQTGAIGGATFTINTGTLPTGLTLSSAGLLSGTPTQTGSFPLTIRVTGGNGCIGTGITYPLLINSSTITVNLKLFLQGYYIGSSIMQSVLNNQTVPASLPTQTDTLSVELHHPTTFALIEKKKAVLSTTGLVSATFTQPAGSYHIAVVHRNTIQTWTKNPVTCSVATPLYNFSTASTQAFGDNQVQVEPGIWAMFTGDLNQDEFIDGNDFPPYDLESASGGLYDGTYTLTDMNGDGFVDGNDFPVFDDNSFNGVSSSHPL